MGLASAVKTTKWFSLKYLKQQRVLPVFMLTKEEPGALRPDCTTQVSSPSWNQRPCWSQRGLGITRFHANISEVIKAFHKLPVLLGSDAGMTRFMSKCGSKCSNLEMLCRKSAFSPLLGGSLAPISELLPHSKVCLVAHLWSSTSLVLQWLNASYLQKYFAVLCGFIQIQLKSQVTGNMVLSHFL